VTTPMPNPTTQGIELPSTELVDQWYSDWSEDDDQQQPLEQYIAEKAAYWQWERLSADLVRATAQGMERAAVICDQYPARDPAQDGNGFWAAENCAEAIRSEASRLQPPTPLPETAKEDEV